MKHVFPKNFYWGTATSSHQIEGHNFYNDWWKAENEGEVPHKSGAACDFFNRYEEDLELASDLYNNAFRMSLEWSRIEPEESQFNEEAVEHYRKILHTAKNKNLKPFVTLHHFTSPVWFSEKGGWGNQKSPEYFKRYVKYVIDHLGDEADFWITINEPLILSMNSYARGVWPPKNSTILSGIIAAYNMAKAHKEAYRVIKSLNKEIKVGVAKNNTYYEPYKGTLLSRFVVWGVDYVWNKWFFDNTKKEQDFIGINYYFHNQVFVRFSSPEKWFNYNDNKNKTDFGWEIYPKGLYKVVKQAWSRYKKPIYIFENGLADKDDDQRSEFIKDHLKMLHKAIKEGANVKGYFHWSLLDNFEWSEGYNMKFGLVEVDFNTLKRTPRESYYLYRDICKNNGL